MSKLDVEENKLTVLSERLVASWTLLTEVNAGKSCSFCSIRNNFLTSLPTEIGELTTLGTFDLHSNKLKEYPVDACKLRLMTCPLLKIHITVAVVILLKDALKFFVKGAEMGHFGAEMGLGLDAEVGAKMGAFGCWMGLKVGYVTLMDHKFHIHTSLTQIMQYKSSRSHFVQSEGGVAGRQQHLDFNQDILVHADTCPTNFWHEELRPRRVKSNSKKWEKQCRCESNMSLESLLKRILKYLRQTDALCNSESFFVAVMGPWWSKVDDTKTRFGPQGTVAWDGLTGMS
ncbi:leucine-rich repeat (LRR) family protein [Artemisia annua]|uniref:Leucine-rich repeat (LRR) family protein n=1 Tax=Artemisia annua TaxID=35608 RepID=A0A2U1KT34_ARTAN|nr:leucine-rich repeat (LRR) family protein [Artemisia annua]